MSNVNHARIKDEWIHFIKKVVVPAKIALAQKHKEKVSAEHIGDIENRAHLHPHRHTEVSSTRYEELKRGAPKAVVTIITLRSLAKDAGFEEGSELHDRLYELGSDYTESMRNKNQRWKKSYNEMVKAGLVEEIETPDAKVRVEEIKANQALAQEKTQELPDRLSKYLLELIQTRLISMRNPSCLIRADELDSMPLEKQDEYRKAHDIKSANTLSLTLFGNTTTLGSKISTAIKSPNGFENGNIEDIMYAMHCTDEEIETAKRVFEKEKAAKAAKKGRG